jgi:uncharacterized protein (DUF1697 family)
LHLGLFSYVAFLRAINVGGNSIVSMAAFKDAFVALGFSDVRTYINSGNVIFSTSSAATQTLAARIEKSIEKQTGMPIKALVLSRAALKQIVDFIPADWVDDRVMRCYVILLWKAVDDPKILAQLPSNPAVEDVRYTPGAVIWRVDRENLGKSRMTRLIGTPLYKQLTMRSANTIRKINALVAV